MLFPVVVHKDPGSTFGVTIPDISGCFTGGDTLDEALRNVQEAVELHLEDATDAPVPSAIDRWAKDPGFKDGMFALVDIDLAFMDDATVRVNITAKRSALAAIDRMARARGEDRSEYLIRSGLERGAAIAAEPARKYATRSLGKAAKLKPRKPQRRR